MKLNSAVTKFFKGNRVKIAIAIFTAVSFVSGSLIGAQIYANAGNNAVAVLPVTKGGTGQNNLAAVLGVGSANKLATARTISLTGNVTGSASFDGSANISIATTDRWNTYTYTWSQSVNPSAATTKTIDISSAGFAAAPTCSVYKDSGTHADYMEYAAIEGVGVTTTSVGVVFYGPGMDKTRSGTYRLTCTGRIR
jgi:hypothetical protein